MKYLCSVLLVLIFTINIYAQQGGMEFTKGDWETVLATAKEQNKLIFVDAYAVWCGPCKMMARNVFPLKAVGDFYNKNFVNVKVDMEKGEGVKLAQKYGVRAYPTFLFVDSNGDLVHRGVGYKKEKAFVNLGEAATDPDRQYMTLMKKYEKGERDADFLLNYAKATYDAGLDASNIADAYLATSKDWLTPKTMKFIYDYSSRVGTKGFDFIVKNKSAFYKAFGKADVIARLDYAIRGASRSWEEVKEHYRAYFPKEADRLSARLDVQKLMRAKDDEGHLKFEKAVIKYLNKYGSDNSNELNSICWHCYEISESPKTLKFAVKWAKKSIKLDSNHLNNDTLAALYYKLGKKKKAMKYAETAIALAKEAGADDSDTRELVKKIEAM